MHSTVLHFAANCENKYLLELLINLDDNQTRLIETTPVTALVNSQDTDGNTPLHKAIMSVNFSNYTALMSHGAKVDISNKEGMTPLHCVVQSGDYKTLKLTLESLTKEEIKDIFKKKNNKNATLLHLAAHIQNKDSNIAYEENVLALLLRYLENVDKELFSTLLNAQDDDGNTAAHIASIKQNFINYVYLTETGAKTDIKNEKVQTAGYLAKPSIKAAELQAIKERIQKIKSAQQPYLLTRLFRSISGAGDGVVMRIIYFSTAFFA